MSFYQAHTDQELLKCMHDDDTSAFTELYNRYWADVFTHVMKVIRSHSDAEDIVQELFESIWKRRKQLEVRGSVAAYLHTGAKYMAIHFMEKHMAGSTYLQSLSDAVLPATMPVAESVVDAKALEKRIALITGRLPDKMREVFRLSRQENLTHKEIAKKLQISEGTVKKQVYNSLKFIREQLGDIASLGCLMLLIYVFLH